MMMMVAAVAIVLGMSACSNDDDKETALATQVEGYYDGNEVIMVMGEESSNVYTTYKVVKASDISVDITIPQSGEMGMVIPPLPVNNITLTKENNMITGKLASFSGTVKDSKGADKAYTVSDMVALFKDNTAVFTFSVKYGNMPFAMSTTFTGIKVEPATAQAGNKE